MVITMSAMIHNKVETLCFILIFFPFTEAVCLHFYCSEEYLRSAVVQDEDHYKDDDYHSVGDGYRFVDDGCHLADGSCPVHHADYGGCRVVVYHLADRYCCVVGCSFCAS